MSNVTYKAEIKINGHWSIICDNQPTIARAVEAVEALHYMNHDMRVVRTSVEIVVTQTARGGL